MIVLEFTVLVLLTIILMPGLFVIYIASFFVNFSFHLEKKGYNIYINGRDIFELLKSIWGKGIQLSDYLETKHVVIFPTNFNPPHKGHLELIKYILRYLKPEKLLLIVDKSHKEGDKVDYIDRLEMTKLMIDEENLKNEVEVRSLSLSRKTINDLRKIHPGWDISFLLKEDSVKKAKSWGITTFETLICGSSLSFKGLHSTSINSKEIRQMDIKEINETTWLSENVKDYILKNRLYNAK